MQQFIFGNYLILLLNVLDALCEEDYYKIFWVILIQIVYRFLIHINISFLCNIPNFKEAPMSCHLRTNLSILLDRIFFPLTIILLLFFQPPKFYYHVNRFVVIFAKQVNPCFINVGKDNIREMEKRWNFIKKRDGNIKKWKLN